MFDWEDDFKPDRKLKEEYQEHYKTLRTKLIALCGSWEKVHKKVEKAKETKFSDQWPLLSESLGLTEEQQHLVKSFALKQVEKLVLQPWRQKLADGVATLDAASARPESRASRPPSRANSVAQSEGGLSQAGSTEGKVDKVPIDKRLMEDMTATLGRMFDLVGELSKEDDAIGKQLKKLDEEKMRALQRGKRQEDAKNAKIRAELKEKREKLWAPAEDRLKKVTKQLEVFEDFVTKFCCKGAADYLIAAMPAALCRAACDWTEGQVSEELARVNDEWAQTRQQLTLDFPEAMASEEEQGILRRIDQGLEAARGASSQFEVMVDFGHTELYMPDSLENIAKSGFSARTWESCAAMLPLTGKAIDGLRDRVKGIRDSALWYVNERAAACARVAPPARKHLWEECDPQACFEEVLSRVNAAAPLEAAADLCDLSVIVMNRLDQVSTITFLAAGTWVEERLELRAVLDRFAKEVLGRWNEELICVLDDPAVAPQWAAGWLGEDTKREVAWEIEQAVLRVHVQTAGVDLAGRQNLMERVRCLRGVHYLCISRDARAALSGSLGLS
mmetsp:Transcript_85097/g.227501  ORF Transcript_85097/g.227501 Transcript_85097/m.227501 type:complete len:560 (-) Transcript_85097:123-1802(-)